MPELRAAQRVLQAWILWLTLCSRLVRCDLTCAEEPLIWRIEEGGRTIFIVGNYHVPASEAPKLAGGPLSEALSCSDVAYFTTGCSLTDTSNVTGVGNYMAHCAYYPVIREKDTISERLSNTTLAGLEDALMTIKENAPDACKDAVAAFSQSVSTVASSAFRKTLLHVFHSGLKAINPKLCGKESQTSYDTFLRQEWGTRKPIFGLEDVSVECQVFQGNSVQQDEDLAEWMATHITPAWVSKVSDLQKDMANAMACGELQQVEEFMAELKGLPLASERDMQLRNANLNFGVHKAMEANIGKNMLFVIPLPHLVDAAGRTGVLSLLAKDNLRAVRQMTLSGCQASSWQAPGAAALDHCLKPPAQSQPQSCIQFEKQFGEILGKDVMHGRKVAPGPHCSACVNSTEACSCQMQWSDYDNFVNLCKSTQVDGSHGRVYYLDMIRNPGSTRSGPALAEKTVAGLYQNCYASSCEIPIIQQMATRNWYKNDPSLDLGSVTVRKLEDPFGELPAPEAGGIVWWPWAVVAVTVALCILCLLRWFHMPKRSQSMRKSNGWEADVDTLKGDMAEMQPLNLKPQSMPLQMRPDGSWTMSDKHYARDVQDLPTLPTDVDIQMPDVQQFSAPSAALSGHRRVISQTRAGPMPAVPQVVSAAPAVPMQQYSLPLQSGSRARPQVQAGYSGSPTAGTSLQGYQGSIAMPGPSAQMAPAAPVAVMAPSGDASLLALSQHMASQIESSGAEAIRSLRHGQYQAVSGSQPQSAYMQIQTPVYQPVAQVPYPYR